MKNLSLFHKLLFFFNLMGSLVAIIALIAPYIPVGTMPVLSTLSLGVPLLIGFHLVFVVYWILARKLHFLLSITILILLYWALGPFYQIPGSLAPEGKHREHLSVMSFNVRGFNKYGWIDDPEIEREIVTLIQNKNPDILCFQEFNNRQERLFHDFPYRYKTPAYTGKAFQAVFSKYPILNSGSLNFPDTFNNALYVDLAVQNDTIRLYNIHLQSFSIVPEMNTLTDSESTQLLSRFSTVMLKQYEQANLIRKNIKESHYPKIVVGDFNNTQYSNIYKIIKGDMQDSFFEKGSNFGRTYMLWNIPLRIDYILADPDLEVLSHENFDQKLSDHYPVMATFRMQPMQ